MPVSSYCLICQKDMRSEGSLEEIFYLGDCICAECRAKMPYFPRKFTIGGVGIEGLYLYQDLLREALIQFKEYNDEALYPLFLYPYVKQLRRRYRGYELLPLPSSEQAYQRRGFRPVELIFSLLELPVIEGFYKKSDIDQKSRSFAQRQQIRSQIALRDGLDLKDRKILLVDDIVTSGATMLTGMKLVRDRAKEVRALTLSYNQRFLSPAERFLQKNILQGR